MAGCGVLNPKPQNVISRKKVREGNNSGVEAGRAGAIVSLRYAKARKVWGAEALLAELLMTSSRLLVTSPMVLLACSWLLILWASHVVSVSVVSADTLQLKLLMVLLVVVKALQLLQEIAEAAVLPSPLAAVLLALLQPPL